MDKQLLEKVQEKALKQTTGLKGRTYTERCAEVGIETLENRRVQQDIQLTFKILKGHIGIDPEQLFKRVNHGSSTRNAACTWNLQKGRARKEIRQQSFGQRVVDYWNALPKELKELENMEAFKRELKKLNRTAQVDGSYGDSLH